MKLISRSLRPVLIALSVLSFATLSNPAMAQSEAELVKAFSGGWVVVDTRFSTDATPCRVLLDPALAADDTKEWRRTDVAPNCAAPLSSGTTWKIADGKIILRGADRTQVAELGGDPSRLSGSYAGAPDAIILERAQGSPAKAALVQAITRHKCYFLGFSDRCADESATQAPDVSEDNARISVLVALNVRSQPRRDAPVIGAVPQDAKVNVNLCLTASDGIWCRARFGDQLGWMAKSAVRQQEWPVITFVNTL